MGFGGISIWQLLIVLVIVMLVFGTKRIKSLGGDLGGAIKSFRKAMDTENAKGTDDGAESGEQKQIETDAAPDAQFAEQKEQQRQG